MTPWLLRLLQIELEMMMIDWCTFCCYHNIVQNLDQFLSSVSHHDDLNQRISQKMAWFSGIADDFNNTQIIVPTPRILRVEDKVDVNPNNFETIIMTRDASWCLDTWNIINYFWAMHRTLLVG